ncbi:Uncharacterised protein [Mycolicibacterium phlei]|uniref:RacP protein n=2 Tax=Mycobacteroides TaxID=670516 RepID=A0A4R8QVU3_9MYCO|nr:MULTISPECIES: hypothetical protein [Mycobacteriaceae]VEG15129.1 Uncharacterised protein [Mycolicibacterium phlei]ANA97150.1 RacP protein [Mycobacteroides chelonae CCUG 47445]MCV7306133.1 hypothetical protein [Mycobacteroides immunogenum]MDO3015660.1 hypothetical protein [Mycobacteroides abscessus subsp. abscessus]OLT80786.1 hypothetical protein BKG56_00260 [Mycobacteroides chelonae]
MPHRIPRTVKSERVRLALLQARPGGLTLQQLCAATGLTASQIRDGLREIKEHAAMEHMTPFAWSRKNGYAFPEEPSDWIAYERAQAHTALTRFVRLITGTVYPHQQLLPHDDYARLLLDQLVGVRASLESITRLAS